MEDVQDSLAPVRLPNIHFSRTMIGAGPVLRLNAGSSRSIPAPAIPMPVPSPNMPAGGAGINVSQMGSIQNVANIFQAQLTAGNNFRSCDLCHQVDREVVCWWGLAQEEIWSPEVPRIQTSSSKIYDA
jgi:hypothetical protein